MKASVSRRAVTFRLRTDLLERLKQLATRENRSLNNYVESILMEVAFNIPKEEAVLAMKEAQNDAELYAYMIANFQRVKNLFLKKKKKLL